MVSELFDLGSMADATHATRFSVMSKQIEDSKQATDELRAQMADLVKSQADLCKSQSHIEAMLLKLVSPSSGQTSRASGLNASPSGCLMKLGRHRDNGITIEPPSQVVGFVPDVLVVHRVDSHVKEVEESSQQSTNGNDKIIAHQLFDQMPQRKAEEEKQQTEALRSELNIMLAELKAMTANREATMSKLLSQTSIPPQPPDPPDFNQFGQRLSKLEFPVFDGTLLDCWIVEVDRFFELEQYGNEEKLDLISLGLEGAALKWFRKHRREFTDWTDIKRKLMARFGLVKGFVMECEDATMSGGDTNVETESLLEKETIPSNVLCDQVPVTQSQDNNVIQQEELVHDTETIMEISPIQEPEPLELADSIFEVDFVNSQEFPSQCQVPIPSLEPNRRCQKESLAVINDLSCELGCVNGKINGSTCDSEIGQDNSLDKEEFVGLVGTEEKLSDRLSLANYVWKPGGMSIELDKCKWSDKCYELSRVMKLMQVLSSTWRSYGKVAELTQELQQPKTYLKEIKLKELDRLVAYTSVGTETWLVKCSCEYKIQKLLLCYNSLKVQEKQLFLEDNVEFLEVSTISMRKGLVCDKEKKRLRNVKAVGCLWGAKHTSLGYVENSPAEFCAYEVYHSPRPPELSRYKEDEESTPIGSVSAIGGENEAKVQKFSSLRTRMFRRREYCDRIISKSPVLINRTLVKRSVRELIIENDGSSSTTSPTILPRCLFMGCRMLVTLKLREAVLVDVTYPFSFPSLKKLSLISMKYPGSEFVNRLLFNCPVLEDLVLEQCEDDNVINLTIKVPSLKRLVLYILTEDGLVIDAPSLEYLDLQDFSDGFSLIENEMPNLVKADVIFLYIHPENILSSVTSVKRLYLCLPSAKDVYPVGSVFHRLIHLTICTCETEWLNLHMYMSHNHEIPELAPCWTKPSLVPECLLSSLETFEWVNYKGTKEEKEVAAFILGSGSCLKNVTIFFKSTDRDEKLEMLKKLTLLTGPLRSPTCQFAFG